MRYDGDAQASKMLVGNVVSREIIVKETKIYLTKVEEKRKRNVYLFTYSIGLLRCGE